jgi:hypothetical protein
MVSATGFGYAGATWWTVPVIGLFLTLLSSGKHIARASRYAELGPTRVLATTFGVSAANNIAFAAMAFLLGRGAAWLLFQ